MATCTTFGSASATCVTTSDGSGRPRPCFARTRVGTGATVVTTTSISNVGTGRRRTCGAVAGLVATVGVPLVPSMVATAPGTCVGPIRVLGVSIVAFRWCPTVRISVRRVGLTRGGTVALRHSTSWVCAASGTTSGCRTRAATVATRKGAGPWAFTPAHCRSGTWVRYNRSA